MLTATVAPASGTGTPTGTVTFMDGTTALGAVVLSRGTARLSIKTLAAGAHSITAVYSGDANFGGNTSAATTQTVNQDSTTETLTTSPDPSVSGQSVTLTASLKAVAPGSGVPTGTVTFADGTTVLGTIALVNGAARLTTKTLPVGSDPITATYSGDGNFLAGTPAGMSQTVNQDATTTTLTVAPNPSLLNQTVTLRAYPRAVAPGTGLPTGTVTFMDGTTALGTATLVNGTAALATASLPFGVNPITAVYNGDGNFLTSTSAAVSQNVQAATSVTLGSSGTSAASGTSVTFTATVLALAPAPTTDVPTGTVTFMDGTAVLGTATLVSGTATFSISTLAVGTHHITAVYSGDTGNRTKTSAALTETIS
jgi:hypothetical protein